MVQDGKITFRLLADMKQRIDALIPEIEKGPELAVLGTARRSCRPSPSARRRSPRRRGNVLVMLAVELDRENDGRWIAEVPDLPGAVAYGATREEAIRLAQALAFRVVAERLEHGEHVPPVILSIFGLAA